MVTNNLKLKTMILLYVILLVIGVVWSILNFILFGKIWSMCNDIKELKERVISITQKEQDRVDEEVKQRTLETLRAYHSINRQTTECGDVGEFAPGDCVVYLPAKRVMLVKEVTSDGYKCVEIKEDGKEEAAGIYKSFQIVKFNG